MKYIYIFQYSKTIHHYQNTCHFLRPWTSFGRQRCGRVLLISVSKLIGWLQKTPNAHASLHVANTFSWRKNAWWQAGILRCQTWILNLGLQDTDFNSGMEKFILQGYPVQNLNLQHLSDQDHVEFSHDFIEFSHDFFPAGIGKSCWQCLGLNQFYLRFNVSEIQSIFRGCISAQWVPAGALAWLLWNLQDSWKVWKPTQGKMPPDGE